MIEIDKGMDSADDPLCAICGIPTWENKTFWWYFDMFTCAGCIIETEPTQEIDAMCW